MGEALNFEKVPGAQSVEDNTIQITWQLQPNPWVAESPVINMYVSMKCISTFFVCICIIHDS